MDTIVGWGTLVVPASSGTCAPARVLMVKRITKTMDSFFMWGKPANPTLLSAFGLTQGQVTHSNKYIFWRKYAVYPLLTFNFGSNNFTAASTIFYDDDALNTDMEDKTANIHLYPNPVTNILIIEGLSHQNILITDISAKVVFSMQNITGRQLVNLAGYSPGFYMVNINGDNGSMIKKITIVH